MGQGSIVAAKARAGAPLTSRRAPTEARLTPPHSDIVTAIRFRKEVGDENGADQMLETLISELGETMRPRLRHLCGYGRAPLGPRSMRGWRLAQRQEMDLVRARYADGDIAGANHLATVLAQRRQPAFRSGVFAECGLPLPDNPDAVVAELAMGNVASSPPHSSAARRPTRAARAGSPTAARRGRTCRPRCRRRRLGRSAAGRRTPS